MILFKCIRKMARLQGYLARASYPPLVNIVNWRGFLRLNDIHFGMLLANEMLGRVPLHTFERSIRETVRWYLDHQDWVDTVHKKG